MTNRTLLILLGPVAGLAMFAGSVKMASSFSSRAIPGPGRALAAAVQAPAAAGQPAAEGLPAAADPAPAAPAPAKPYEEAAVPGRSPSIGSRVAIWIVAQLHLLFAAFVLAVPIFAFIIELIGYKTGDKRYDRLAHEFTKLLSIVVLVHGDLRRVR